VTRVRVQVAATFLVFATSVFCEVAGGEECSTCGEPAFPEAAAFLAGNGYPTDAYTVLMSWQEAAPRGDRRIVTGYHVLPAEGGQAFDLYSDSSGKMLDVRDLDDLGIRPKHWTLPPIEQQSEIPAELKRSLPPRPVPLGPRSAKTAPAVVALPPIDLDALLEEDAQAAAAPEKAAQRVGIVRTLPEPIVVAGVDQSSAGVWQTLADGTHLWSATLQSPEARAIRVYFAALRLPPGGEVIVYNTNNPTEAYGPYVRPYGSDTDVWGASCFSDTVTVECRVPADRVRDTRSQVQLANEGPNVIIDEVVHTYADFGLMAWSKVAGSCHNDVTCYPDWEATARAVGGFTVLIDRTQLHCTGTLLADTDPTGVIPYFLTANHCVSLQDGATGASTMEFFWLYQTPTCDGVPPALSTVPRTSGGGDLLATVSVGAGTDFTLVRMRSMPPEGLTYVGWSTEPVAVGTDVAAIHHPQGEYKRISFGHTTDTGSPQNGDLPIRPYSFFLEVHWDQGSTEVGSSGAPLFLADTQVLVGQLWGGYASCDAMQEPDYFGRFDKTFPVVEPWLMPPANPMDVDHSGTVDSADIQLVVNAALGMPISYNADVDRSGAVDAVDVQLIILAVLKSTGS